MIMLRTVLPIFIIAAAYGCGTNEVFKDCKGCDKTCDQVLGKSDPPCPTICLPGCACAEGYVRQWEPFSQCLPKSSCKQDCKRGEEYQECGSLTEPTCENPFPKNQGCTKGCYCQPGFVRGPDWNCIFPDQCSKIEKCPPGEVWQQCSGCDETCDNKTHICPYDCRPGCSCLPGYVRFGDLTRSYCAPASECPIKKKCGTNEVFKECMGCTVTCSKPKGGPCPTACFPGCECVSGYVRDDNGYCVEKSSCPGAEIAPFAVTALGDTSAAGPKGSKDDDGPYCAAGLEWTECEARCAPTCGDPENKICPLICAPGCICKKGTMMDSDSGKCVPPDECPKSPPACPENEEFIGCGPSCIETCLNKPTICTANCVQGCFCKPGFVREDQTKKCILKADCPPHVVSGQTEPECPYKDMEFQACGSACPPTCFEPNPTICTYNCVPGCFCKSGLLLSPTGICIPKDKCPQSDAELCPPGSEYNECGSTCPATCDGIAKVCSLACKRGCFCKYTYVIGPDGNCIKSDRCPNNTKLGKLASLDITVASNSCKQKQDGFAAFCKQVRRSYPMVQFCAWKGFRESCARSCCLFPQS